MSEFSYACGERPQPSPDARDEFVTHRRLINKLLADTTVQQARIAALEEESKKDRARISAVEAAIRRLTAQAHNVSLDLRELGFAPMSPLAALSEALDRTNADYVPPPTPPSPPCETCGGTRKIDKDWPGEPCGPRMRPCPDCAKPAAPKPEIRAVRHQDGTWDVVCGAHEWQYTHWTPHVVSRQGRFGGLESHARAIADLLDAEGNRPEVGT